MDDKRFTVAVGIRDLPFPIKVLSRTNPQGQHTTANISVDARIMHEFESRWIDRFIQIIHRQGGEVDLQTLRPHLRDYLNELKASMVRLEVDYPFFVTKLTPLSKERCLVRYLCTYAARISSINDPPELVFTIRIPVITTYPGSTPDRAGGLFGQLSIVTIETVSAQEIYPEDLVDIADQHALSPVYSFLTDEDELFLIQKVHSDVKTSIVMMDEIRLELARRRDINRFTVRCSNFGMLHSYGTLVATERSRWIPFSGYEEEL